MRRLLLGLSMAILVMAKPELYREKEDFQYSRSSSDEGSKSGYYDAQRGNMGGNYERAHNMDGLAQHQMGGLVKQVEGELGDGSKTRTGSVFTAANSQGIYGSGRYDLSNVAGRNFQEGVSYHDSQSHLSAANRAHSSQYSAINSGRYNTDSLSHSSSNGGFHQADNLQEAQNAYGAREYEHGSHAQHSSKYYVRSGYQGNSDYEQLNLNQQASNNFGADSQARLVSQVPVRIVVRPGTRVAIPIATQAHSGLHATSYDQSNFNSDAEVLNTGDQQAAFRPSGDAKHYESSYSYRKEWEKHNTKPLAVPLATSVVPVAKSSELYDESRLHDRYTQNAEYNLGSSHLLQQAGFNSQHSALSSDSQHEANYNARQHTASSNVNSNAFSQSGYNALANSNSDDLTGVITSKPKSYHSSYSYHKSWERQGDPYVIVPPSSGAYNGQTSQRLTDISGSQGEYSSHNFGSRKSHQAYTVKDCVIECDPNSHIRVARSYNSKPAHFEEQNQYTQQSQNLWDEFGQQTQNQRDRLEDLGQQTQDAGQQVQNKLENLEDLGQQTQNLWGDETQNAGQQVQNKWDNLADLGQQTQNSWGQQTQQAGQQVHNKLENLEDLGQQTQNLWGDETQNAGQQVQNKWDNLADLGQQTQNSWGQQTQQAGQPVHNKLENLEDLGQQTQNLWGDETQNAGQQVQNKWDNLADLGQQTQNSWGQQTQQAGQPVHNKLENLEDLGQQTQNLWGDETQNAGQQVQNKWDNLADLGQQTQNSWGQQTQQAGQPVHNKLENLEDLGQQTQNLWGDETQNAGQQVQNKWDNLADLGQQTQNSWGQQTQQAGQPVHNELENLEDLGQQTQDLWRGETQDAGQQIQNKWENLGQQTQDGGQVTENKWNLGQRTQSLSEEKTGQGAVNGWNNLESFGQQSEQGQDQQTQDIWDTQKPTEVEDLGQRTQTQWDQSDKHEQQVFSEDTQQTEHDRLDKPPTFDSQDALGLWPNQHNTEEQTSQNVDLNQQAQGFGFKQSFDEQNVFEQTIHHDKSQENPFIPENLNQQTQGLWNHFDNQFSFDHNSNRNTENNKPNTNTHEPKNTGSLNGLWGKLDNLDGDYVSSFGTSQTQNTDYSQASSFDSLWGKLDDLDADIAPSIVTTPETHNVDLSQSSNSHNIWNQESLIGVEDLKTSTEKLLKVTDIPADEKQITTTQKSQEGKIQTSDFGRGDIGAEDVIIDASTTTQKTSSQYDIPSNKETTERIGNKEHKNKNEKHKPDETQFSDIQTEQKHEPTRHIFDQENEQVIPLNFPGTLNKDDMQHQNKPSHNPESHVVNVEVPKEIEQQFETQNVQEHEHKFDYFEQKPAQHEIGQEQNSEFGIFDQKMPRAWEQYPNHPDVADQQFVDFSQTNQQWHMEQQNFQQQFSDDFYQQNQNSPSQNRNADVFDQENVESLPDFGQQSVKSEFEVLPTTEQQIVKKDYVENFGQQENKKLEKEEVAPPEPVTQNTGFWKSVGNKFASAKDKVFSWFSG